MKRLVNFFLAITGFFLIMAASAGATVVNPLPALYGPDDGSVSAPELVSLVSVEIADYLGESMATSFGFFYLNDLSSFTPVFFPDDQGGSQGAIVDFTTGKIFDTDASVFEPDFTPGTGDIGFYYTYSDGQNTVLLTSVPGLNPGGVDYAASFPHLTNPGEYLIGFGDLTNPNPAPFAYYQIAGTQAPVPVPGTLLLLGSGLAGLLSISRRK